MYGEQGDSRGDLGRMSASRVNRKTKPAATLMSRPALSYWSSSSPVIPGGTVCYSPIGASVAVAGAAPEELARITPEQSVKKVRTPLRPATDGLAFAV